MVTIVICMILMIKHGIKQKQPVSPGGHLVEISDASTLNFIVSTAKSIGWDKFIIWIGASDRVREGHWQWRNGKELSYSNWARGSPKKTRKRRFLVDDISDVFPDYSATVSDCTIMDIKRHGQWIDFPCSYKKLHFICQFELKHSTTSPEPVTTTTSTTTTTTSTSTTTATTAMTRTTEHSTEVINSTNDSGASFLLENTTSPTFSTDLETQNSEQTNMPTNLLSNTTQEYNITGDAADRQIDNRGSYNEPKIGLILGMSVLGVIIIVVISAVVVVCQKIKFKHKIELKDVVAFDNTVYRNTDDGEETTATQTDTLSDTVHIYQMPEDCQLKIEETTDTVPDHYSIPS